MAIASELHLDSEVSEFQLLTNSCEGTTLATIHYYLIISDLRLRRDL